MLREDFGHQQPHNQLIKYKLYILQATLYSLIQKSRENELNLRYVIIKSERLSQNSMRVVKARDKIPEHKICRIRRPMFCLIDQWWRHFATCSRGDLCMNQNLRMYSYTTTLCRRTSAFFKLEIGESVFTGLSPPLTKAASRRSCEQ